MDVCGQLKEELGSKVVDDSHKPQQARNIGDYLKKSEELNSLKQQRTPTLLKPSLDWEP